MTGQARSNQEVLPLWAITTLAQVELDCKVILSRASAKPLVVSQCNVLKCEHDYKIIKTLYYFLKFSQPATTSFLTTQKKIVCIKTKKRKLQRIR